MKVVSFALSVVFLIAAVNGHAQMRKFGIIVCTAINCHTGTPSPRAPRVESQEKYCGSGTNTTGNVTVRVQAGRRLQIVSQPNTHEGQGDVVIKLLSGALAAPTADQYNGAPTLVKYVYSELRLPLN